MDEIQQSATLLRKRVDDIKEYQYAEVLSILNGLERLVQKYFNIDHHHEIDSIRDMKDLLALSEKNKENRYTNWIKVIEDLKEDIEALMNGRY